MSLEDSAFYRVVHGLVPTCDERYERVVRSHPRYERLVRMAVRAFIRSLWRPTGEGKQERNAEKILRSVKDPVVELQLMRAVTARAYAMRECWGVTDPRRFWYCAGCHMPQPKKCMVDERGNLRHSCRAAGNPCARKAGRGDD